MAAQPSLPTRAIRGVFWTGSPFLVQLFITLVFYAYLPRDDMGRFEWALLFVMLLALLGDLGLGQALVQFRAARDIHFQSAFWTNCFAGLSITGLVFLSAPYSAALLGGEEPAIFQRVLLAFSLLLPFASVSGFFRGLLARELRFRSMALAEIVSVLVYSAAAMALLYRGYGIMSPILGGVVREMAFLATLWWTSAWRPRLRFSFAALGEILPFGLHLTGSKCVNYINTNLPRLFIFPFLGAAAMAHYSLAHRLTLLPLGRLSTTITRVSFPTFARLQAEEALLRRGYLKSVQSLALVVWPVLAGAGVFAPEVLAAMRSLDGRDLSPVLAPLRLLALAALFKTIGMIVASVLNARGKANWTFYWTLFSFAVLIPVLYYSLEYGVEGIAAVIALTALLFLGLSQHLANRLIHLSFAAYAKALVRPALVALVVLAALLGGKTSFSGPPPRILILAAFTGGAAYALALRLLARDLCRQFWRNFRGGGGKTPSDPLF